MNCKTVEMFLYNYLDNELTEQECLEIEEHLNHCNSCRNLYNYETEFHNYFKSKIQEDIVEIPLDLKDKILNNKSHFFLEYNILSIKNLASLSILFISIIFISKVSMGYSTLPVNYKSDFKKNIKIASNNELKLSKWIKKHNYKNLKILKFDRKKLKMTPMGLAFDKKNPILFYHYKGNKVLYKNIKNKIITNNFKRLVINNKVFFINCNSNLSIALWKNKNGTTSLLSSRIPEKQFQKILYTIK